VAARPQKLLHHAEGITARPPLVSIAGMIVCIGRCRRRAVGVVLVDRSWSRGSAAPLQFGATAAAEPVKQLMKPTALRSRSTAQVGRVVVRGHARRYPVLARRADKVLVSRASTAGARPAST
jgi:hypothetical protein